MASNERTGPPYLPVIASIGGVPTIGVDVPICAIYLVLFAIGAASHMTIFQLNKRKRHKFLMSAFLYGFSMARIMSCIMRIVWACYPAQAKIAIAAVIFVTAGVLILFTVNLIFAQRMLRSTLPYIGWNRVSSIVFKVLYVITIFMLAIAMTAIIQSFYSINPSTNQRDRNIQLVAETYFMILAFAPIPIVIFSMVASRNARVERFGTGRLRTKVWALLTTATLLTFGASFRTGTTFKTPRLKDDPAWYDAKWCFYIVNFTVEVIVVYLYLILRVDQRFHVPNGSHGPGDYSRSKVYPGLKREAGGRDSFSSYAAIISEETLVNDNVEPEFRIRNDVGCSRIHHRPLAESPYIEIDFLAEDPEKRQSWPAEVAGIMSGLDEWRLWPTDGSGHNFGLDDWQLSPTEEAEHSFGMDDWQLSPSAVVGHNFGL